MTGHSAEIIASSPKGAPLWIDMGVSLGLRGLDLPRERSADEASQPLGGHTAGQDLRSVAQTDQEAPRVERAQELDRLEIDDVRAVDLEEDLGVQA